MARSSSQDVQRGEEDGGEIQQNMSTSLGTCSVEGSECASAMANTGGDGETSQEPGVAGKFVTSMSSPSWYQSARIEHMIQTRDKYRTSTEFEIDASTSHWSEVDSDVSEWEHSAEANREYFDVLRRRRYVREGGQLVAKQVEHITQLGKYSSSLFDPEGYWNNLEVGEKLAEGGQAEIYAARVGRHDRYVVKVFKAGSVLKYLEKQIPPALMKLYQFDCYEPGETDKTAPRILDSKGFMLLRDERLLDRFAFVMERHWGDLRKLIDQRMMESHNQGPGFPPHVLWDLMWKIAYDMKGLHGLDPPIVHKGLKAANVLVNGLRDGRPRMYRNGTYLINVADYECSVGVVGTGLWRAQEILQQLQDRVPMAEVVVTKACDVYSYGMTCYELVCGHIPYGGYASTDARDRILKGERPQLPPDLNPLVKDLIRRCWHPNPSKRPSFANICKELVGIADIWKELACFTHIRKEFIHFANFH